MRSVAERHRMVFQQRMALTTNETDLIKLATERTGIQFKQISLLETALTHESFLNENPGTTVESNERLEFLGDSALNYIVGRYLYETLPDLPEGDLTVRRAEAVRKETLAEAGTRLGLGDLLIMGRGETASGGANRPSNMANGFEALVGAILLDRGIDAARDFVIKWLEPALQRLVSSHTPKDPKSHLQELLQAKGGNPPEYRLMNVEGPDNSPEFTVEVIVNGDAQGRGVAGRKIEAERIAALEAIDALNLAEANQPSDC
jgi:ribonuclease-3